MSKKYTIEGFADALNNLAKDVRTDALKDAAMAGGGVIEAHAKLNASSGRPGLNVDTSNLVNSIKKRLTKSRHDSATVEISTNVEYARIHEYGGIIKPLRKEYLHFVIDGQHIQTKSVTIPARPYMRPAVDENEKDIIKAINTQIKKAVERAI